MGQIFNWDEEHDAIQNIKLQQIGNETILECIERAGRAILIDLEKGCRFGNIKTELQVRFEKEYLEARFPLPTRANDEQKMLYNHCGDQIENMLRESHGGQKYMIEDADSGDLTTWTFG